MFSNQRDATSALLILRHLHDGEAIDYPVPVGSPHAHLFAQLESDGYIERWDRFWPLSDRYRLTARGAQTIRSCYRPGNAAAVMKQLLARHLAPGARPQALRAMGFDPSLWPILHDPATDWRLWPAQIGPFQRYIWEEHLLAQRPPQPAPAAGRPAPRAGRAPAPQPRQAPRPRPYGNQVYVAPVQHSSWADSSSPWYDSGYSSSWASEAASYAHRSSHHEPAPFVGGGGESGGGGSTESWGDDAGSSGGWSDAGSSGADAQGGGYDTDDLDGSSGSGGSYSDAS